MNLINSLRLFTAFTILLQAVPSLASIYFVSGEHGTFCPQIYDDLSACSTVPSGKLYYLHDEYPNLTSPLIAIETNDKLSGFDVRFKSGKTIHKVRTFTMLAEDTDVDIDLMDTSNNVTYIACVSFGSFSKLTTNIILSNQTSIQSHSNRNYPDLKTYSELTVSKAQLQSGRFTCHSADKQKHAETFNIFTQPSASDHVNPFVSVPEWPLQSHETGNGYTVPCRTNLRLKTQPNLLWKTHEKGDFTSLTAEDKENFNWDPSVGFQFNKSDQFWEMSYFECRVDSFTASVLPTPGHFEKSISIETKGAQIGCSLGQRNGSVKLYPADTKYQKAGYYECSTLFKCDLALESGVHFRHLREYKTEIDTFGTHILDLNINSGIVSCFCEHIYEGSHVPESSSMIFFRGLDSQVYILPGSHPASSVIQISQVDGPFYKEQAELYHEFTCETVNFMAYKDVHLILRYRDLTERTMSKEITSGQNALYSQTYFDVALHANMTHAVCLCLTQDGKEMRAETTLQVVETFAPVIDNTTTGSKTFNVGDMDKSIHCPIIGAPKPTYRWTFAEENQEMVHGENTSILIFHHIHEKMAGNYTCEASNQYGNNSFSFQISVEVKSLDITSARSATAVEREDTTSATSTSKGAQDFPGVDRYNFMAVVTLSRYVVATALKL